MSPMQSEAFRAWFAGVDWIAAWNAFGIVLFIAALGMIFISNDDEGEE